MLVGSVIFAFGRISFPFPYRYCRANLPLTRRSSGPVDLPLFIVLMACSASTVSIYRIDRSIGGVDSIDGCGNSSERRHLSLRAASRYHPTISLINAVKFFNVLRLQMPQFHQSEECSIFASMF
ncbi:hypothetical protein ACOME3_000178 [Neoechinorhynchus agilis]